MTNKEIGNYLIWVALNLVVLLVFGTLKFGYYSFYPLEGFDELDEYDISEFLAYTIIPLLMILATKLRKEEGGKSD